jgi:fibronectin type 3 domain-containing protein
VKLLQQGIKLFFSPSKSEDVELHSLTRSNVKDNEQKTVLQFLVSDTLTNSFIDTSAVLGESYSYNLTAFDEDVNKSSSTPRFIIFETGFRPKVKDLNAKVDLEKRKISLSWANSRGEVDKYILYRASDNEPYTIIITLEPNKNSFIDNELNIGNTYYYKIKAVFKNGAESIFNNPIKVIY